MLKAGFIRSADAVALRMAGRVEAAAAGLPVPPAAADAPVPAVARRAAREPVPIVRRRRARVAGHALDFTVGHDVASADSGAACGSGKPETCKAPAAGRWRRTTVFPLRVVQETQRLSRTACPVLLAVHSVSVAGTASAPS